MYIIGLHGTHPTSDKSFFLSTSLVSILSLYYPLTFAPLKQKENSVPGCLKCNLTKQRICHIPRHGVSQLWAVDYSVAGGFHTDFS